MQLNSRTVVKNRIVHECFAMIITIRKYTKWCKQMKPCDSPKVRPISKGHSCRAIMNKMACCHSGSLLVLGLFISLHTRSVWETICDAKRDQVREIVIRNPRIGGSILNHGIPLPKLELLMEDLETTDLTSTECSRATPPGLKLIMEDFVWWTGVYRLPLYLPKTPSCSVSCRSRFSIWSPGYCRTGSLMGLHLYVGMTMYGLHGFHISTY